MLLRVNNWNIFYYIVFWIFLVNNCILTYHNWASTRENLYSGICEQTYADQPAHSRSLISAFVILFLEYNICKPATVEILIFLASP